MFYPVTILNKGSQKDLLEDFIKNAGNKKADKRNSDLASHVENAKFSLSVLEEVYQIQTERLQALTEETGGKIFLVAICLIWLRSTQRSRMSCATPSVWRTTQETLTARHHAKNPRGG